MAMDANTPQEKVCNRLKKIGYSRSRVVTLYGEKLQLVSDPYPEGKDFVIEVHSQDALKARVVRIPQFIVSSARAA
jgi:hypothetical protein